MCPLPCWLSEAGKASGDYLPNLSQLIWVFVLFCEDCVERPLKGLVVYFHSLAGETAHQLTDSKLSPVGHPKSRNKRIVR